jgi:hypothetical protein
LAGKKAPAMRAGRPRSDAKNVHGLGDVLDLLRADIGEGRSDPRPDMLAHRARDADAAGLGQRLQPRRDVHRVAEEVAVPCHHVAEVEADAELHAAVGRRVGIFRRHRLLDRERAGETVGDAGKLGEDGVARGVGDAAAVFGDQRIDERAAGAERAHRRILVGPHQPAVFGDVGREDRGQPPFGPLRQFGILPARSGDITRCGNAGGFLPPTNRAGRGRSRAG